MIDTMIDAMIQPTKWRTRMLIVLAAVLGVGSVALLALWPLGTLRIARPQWSELLILSWDVLLSLMFFVQHSWMLRTGARARLAAVIPPVYQSAVYATASGLALLVVVLLWQPSTVRFFALVPPWRYVAHGFTLAALALFIWGFRSLRSFDPLGIRPLTGHLRSKPSQPCPFAVRGAYRLVRHPLYLAIIVLFWSNPDLTADRLLFDGLWTAWIVLGTLLEERDLVAELGDVYRSYRRSVPMLIPLPRPRAGQPVEGELPSVSPPS
jgi:protein-S-isoprenylcysteine O-methyltransferase Ste14